MRLYKACRMTVASRLPAWSETDLFTVAGHTISMRLLGGRIVPGVASGHHKLFIAKGSRHIGLDHIINIS